jgi:hypothetical protein
MTFVGRMFSNCVARTSAVARSNGLSDCQDGLRSPARRVPKLRVVRRHAHRHLQCRLRDRRLGPGDGRCNGESDAGDESRDPQPHRLSPRRSKPGRRRLGAGGRPIPNPPRTLSRRPRRRRPPPSRSKHPLPVVRGPVRFIAQAGIGLVDGFRIRDGVRRGVYVGVVATHKRTVSYPNDSSFGLRRDPQKRVIILGCGHRCTIAGMASPSTRTARGPDGPSRGSLPTSRKPACFPSNRAARRVGSREQKRKVGC